MPAKKARSKMPRKPLGLLERLVAGPVICAEGYLFEFERRGYLQAGAYVPEVVLEHPDLVEGLHRDFVHAGSDVVEAIKRSGKPAVITVSVPREGHLREGWTAAEACRRLEDAGADVVGMNCARGPATMLPLLREIRAAVTCHVAALPVPYRTTPAEPTFQSLTDPHGISGPDGRPFPTALDPFLCSRYEIAEFGTEASALGVRYLGVCCGAGPP